MTTTGSGSKGKETKSPSSTTAATGATASVPKQMLARAIALVSRMSRTAKAAVIAIVAVVVLVAMYCVVQNSFKDDVDFQNSVTQYLVPILTPHTVSSMTAADMTNPCRLLLRGFSNDFTKANLACLDSPDTFKGIVVTADQAARFCNGIAKVSSVAGMRCVSGMYRKMHHEMRPNERRPDFAVSKRKKK